VGIEDLIEHPPVRVQHEHVTVAVRLGTPLDGSAGRNGIGPRIAFVTIVEGDGHPRLVA